MGPWELVAVAVGLSMDAFAVSIGKGLSVRRATLVQSAAAGLWFGGFQALMPLLGYLAGSRFGGLIRSFDHWVAFALLVFIGAKMVLESRSAEGPGDDRFDAAAMLPLAVATSIDALAAGISFAFLGVSIVSAVALIGCVTFGVSVAGVRLGAALGSRYKSGAELFGGLVLMGIGVRILLQHLGIWG